MAKINKLASIVATAARMEKKADKQGLEQIFEKEMGSREPIIETANGVFYFQPKGDKIIFGTATNVGISQDYVFDYDFDMNFDQNIQSMSEEVLEKEGYYTESSKKSNLTKKASMDLEEIKVFADDVKTICNEIKGFGYNVSKDKVVQKFNKIIELANDVIEEMK